MSHEPPGRSDVFDPAFVSDPYPAYTELRRGPVTAALTPNGMKVWLVTRYEDVRAGLADPRLSKDVVAGAAVLDNGGAEGQAMRALPPSIGLNLLSMDAPQHTRLRQIVGKAFTVRRVERLRPRIAEIADALLDGFAGQAEIDLVTALARPLPILLMAELLGLPEADTGRLRDWTETLVSMSTRPADEFVAAGFALHGYLGDVIAAKRAEPADDLVSSLIVDGAAEQLTDEELISIVAVLIIGGFETTANLVGNAMLALFAHPDQLAALRDDAALLPGAVDELIRFDGPVHMGTFRFTREPVDLGGTTIPAGEIVMLSLLAANRDEEQFPGADRLDVRRFAAGHVGFGHGPHYCVGAALARAEGEIVLHKLLTRFPAIRLAGRADEVPWQFTLLTRGADRIPVVLH